MERLEAIVSGRVQMVMFRDFACRKAHGLGLKGEVQNLNDKTVRVIAEGSRETLEVYVKKLEKGPLLARVDRVQTVYTEPTSRYTDFSIRYD